MSIERFRPDVWSKVTLSALRKSLVYAAPGVVNRDYEGEIQDAGDTVRITSISDPSIGDYVPNVTTIVPEELTDAQRTLVIDKLKYFAFKVDDVDARQAAGSVLPEAMSRSAYKLRDAVDQNVAGLYTQIQTVNRLNSGNALTVGDGTSSTRKVYDVLVDLGVVLDEANVQGEARYAVIPPWCKGWLQKDPNFINAEKSADGGRALRNGIIGEAAGFTIRVSNNVPNPSGANYVVQVGVDMAISHAEQISKVEAYRPESSFSDAVKGLLVWGSKMIRPEAAAYALLTKP